MTACARWLLPQFDWEKIPFVFVPEQSRKGYSLCNVDDHFPAFRGVKIPMLQIHDPKLVYQFKSRASLIRSLLEQEFFVNSVWASWAFSNEPNGKDVAFWENGLHNQLSMLMRYDKDKDEFAVPFYYGKSEMREDVEDINCTVYLTRCSSGDKLQLKCIEWSQGKSTPKSPNWQRALSVATCSLMTYATFIEHFLTSHLLTVGSINALAHTYLPKSHPIGLLIYMHSIGIHQTNVIKGHPLLNENFTQDFSLTPKGLVEFVEFGTQEFDISRADPRSRFTDQGYSMDDDLVRLPYWNDLISYYDIFYEYAKEWVLTSYTSLSEMQSDSALLKFWSELRQQSFAKNLGSLSQKRLIHILATFLWISIYKHEQVGDKLEDLVDACQLFIPKDPEDLDCLWRQRVAKSFFNFVFVIATQTPAVKLLSCEWVKSLPKKFRPIAQRMQTAIRKQGKLDLELGTNK